MHPALPCAYAKLGQHVDHEPVAYVAHLIVPNHEGRVGYELLVVPPQVGGPGAVPYASVERRREPSAPETLVIDDVCDHTGLHRRSVTRDVVYHVRATSARMRQNATSTSSVASMA